MAPVKDSTTQLSLFIFKVLRWNIISKPMCSLYDIHIHSTFEKFLTSHQLTAAQHTYAHVRHSERIHMFNQWGEVLPGALSEGLNGHMTNCPHPMASDVNVSVLLWLKGHYRECERKEDWSLKNGGRESINTQTAKGLWRSKQITERAFSSSFAGGKTLRRDCFSSTGWKYLRQRLRRQFQPFLIA